MWNNLDVFVIRELMLVPLQIVVPIFCLCICTCSDFIDVVQHIFSFSHRMLLPSYFKSHLFLVLWKLDQFVIIHRIKTTRIQFHYEQPQQKSKHMLFIMNIVGKRFKPGLVVSSAQIQLVFLHQKQSEKNLRLLSQ